MKSIIKTFLFSSILGWATLAHSQTTNYKTHAVFIFSIAKYSKWPSLEGSEFVITVLGKSKLYDELVAGASNHNVSGLKITVLSVEDVSQVTKSNMVVVSDGKSGSLDKLIEATTGQPVMIITEREDLYKRGAGISFFVNDEGKLNFDMNLTDMNRRTLSLSQSLTKLATKVI